jgi:hypothetical protein
MVNSKATSLCIVLHLIVTEVIDRFGLASRRLSAQRVRQARENAQVRVQVEFEFRKVFATNQVKI